MSVQFGRWNSSGQPLDPAYLAKVKSIIASYGPDGEGAYAIPNLCILYRAFHTTKESRVEMQPHVTASGRVLTWDGRLDNRVELIGQLGDVLTASATDISIVTAAYGQWGTDCFAKLIGDWALSIWDAKSRYLILAKDPVGTRHLYYSIEKEHITWSTILDPLVLFADKTFGLCEEYIAGWLSQFPATHLTPYVGIHSVPPSSFALLRSGKHTVSKYWDFNPSKRIRYRSDLDYEEHFRTVFAEAVRRRLRCDSPVLAELSGGMDSSSIVCMADMVIARGDADTLRLDTVSYYDDSEPHWNERPYFTTIEQRRGRAGCHIDVSSHILPGLGLERRFLATPGSIGGTSGADAEFARLIDSQNNRVVLSGIGGDEVMGGVPTPTPELEDLLTRGKVKALTHALKVWALNRRRPWFQLLFEATRGFLPPVFRGVSSERRPPAWLNPSFVRRHRASLAGYESRLKVFGPTPSFQENLKTLEALRRQIACSALNSAIPCEKRYPFLDRDLLEFIYAIPREQLVRPGKRRSLMRRALAGITPDEVLNRKRKAFVARTPLRAISSGWANLVDRTQPMISESLGIVEQNRLAEVLKKAHDGQEVPVITLVRTFLVDHWINSVNDRKLLSMEQPPQGSGGSHLRLPIMRGN
jgi:asparagine synthase (glutamine-hydrolysing)